MLSYEAIFSRARNRVNDPIELSLKDDDLIEIYTERLHSTVGNIRVRELFSKLDLDDTVQRVDFTLKYPVDDASDADFVINVFALGMAIEWLEPRVKNVLYTQAFIGSDKEKKILDGHGTMNTMLSDMKKELSKLIRDYGNTHNSYIEES